jgi:triacylglycerol esterase/lipase EstA (alpha/beta hydrolase family)
MITACAAPFSIRRLAPQQAQLQLTANVLTTGELSGFSKIVLRRYDLLDTYEKDPESALAALRDGGVKRIRDALSTQRTPGARIPPADDELFALAELSYRHAEKTAGYCCRRPHYLAAALYAYALLFPGPDVEPLELIDPRTRIAADIYNRALAEAFESKHGDDMELAAGVYQLPFGRIEVSFDPASLEFGDGHFTDFLRSADFEVKGLINRYRKAGIGTPLAAHFELPKKSALRRYVSRYLRTPSTALLRIEQPRSQIQTDYVRGRLDFYSFSSDASVTIDEREVPLESEPSAALAAFMTDSKFWTGELATFLGRTLKTSETAKLTALEPQRGRIPLVFVHGTNSSPGRWADTVNDLLNDPTIHSRYAFWFFEYTSSNPIAYSAMGLRQELTGAMTLLDANGVDDCVHSMVVMGHSQGGLLTKMTAIDSGNRLWEQISSKPFEEARMPEETRRIVQNALFVKPLPFVKRVIFVATPHRGSFLAGPQIVRRLIERLVTLPVDVLRVGADLAGVAVGYESRTAALSMGRVPTSIDNMSPGNPFIKALSEIPVAPGIAVNSIIPVKQGYDPYQEGNDGVVKYTSAHIEPVESEVVVRSPHSTQSNPHTIEEIRRILRKHALDVGCGPIELTPSPTPRLERRRPS